MNRREGGDGRWMEGMNGMNERGLEQETERIDGMNRGGEE